MRGTLLSGRVWLLTDPEGRLYDDVDTDQIYHNRHLHVTDVTEMGQYALGNLQGWRDFPSRARPSDVVVAGRNFGAGSSRQHAVDCFVALGVSAVVAESFGAIYKRNAINSGFAVLEVAGLTSQTGRMAGGQRIDLDLAAGQLTTDGGEVFLGKPFSGVQMDIYLAGDLFAYGRSLSEQNRVPEARRGSIGGGGAQWV
jgi:3-isopropylmalate/(R)-2-methylmalate dehydratase small subunit